MITSVLLLLMAAPLVVLDPGHGGGEIGTTSAQGVSEKTVVLGIARAAAVSLRKGGVQVRLTRTADTHVDLASRVMLANRKNAVAFVSIHCNWAPVSQRRGVETYVLSAEASDADAASLLAAEESAMVDDESFAGGGADDLSFILNDLGKRAAQAESTRLARTVQDALAKVTGLLPSRGLRQAPFRVLRKVDMPAVLVELGYLSHEGQARWLASAKGQRAAGAALAAGVRRYLKLQKTRKLQP